MSSSFSDLITKALLKSVAEYECKFGVTLEEALEKQVLKLCENQHPVFNEFDEIAYWVGDCPKYKEKINFSESENYCHNCGQALKYEEE